MNAIVSFPSSQSKVPEFLTVDEWYFQMRPYPPRLQLGDFLERVDLLCEDAGFPEMFQHRTMIVNGKTETRTVEVFPAAILNEAIRQLAREAAA